MEYRLIPFQFSTEDQYMLEFSDLTIRVIKDGELVQSGGGDLLILSPYSADALEKLHYAQSADILFIAHPDYPPYKLSRTSDTSWTMEAIEFKDGPYLTREFEDSTISIEPSAASGTVTLEASADIFTADMIDMPFRLGYPDAEDPTDIQWGWGYIDSVTDAQTATLTTEDAFGYEMIYNGEFDANLDGWENYDSNANDDVSWDSGTQSMRLTKGDPDPYEYACEVQQVDYFLPRTTVRISFTLTVASAITTGVRCFVGTSARGTNLLTPQWAMVIGPGSATFAYVFRTPSSTDKLFVSFDNYGMTLGNISYIDDVSLTRKDLSTNEWRAPAWGDPSVGRQYGFPQNVVFHEQRLCFSNTYAFPQTIWMSKSGSFYDFSFASPGADDDTISYMLASRKINAIEWMISSSDLILGTYSGIWRMSPGGQTDAITPTSVVAKLQTSDGCAPLDPLMIGSTILYVQRGNKSVRSLKYSLEADSYQGDDITVLARHYFETRSIISWDYAALPYQIIWCVADDGVMLGLTYMPEHEVMAWHKHTTGDPETDGFLYVSVLQTAFGDEVYLLARRGDNTCIEMFEDRIRLALNGTVETKETAGIERITDEGNTYPYRYWFVDSAVGFNDVTPTYWIDGLDHLEGRQVSALADGQVFEDITVESGEVTIESDRDFYRIISGLPVVSKVETLDLEIPDNSGSTIKRVKVVNKLILRLFRSRFCEIAPRGENFLNEAQTTENFEEIKIRELSDGENPTALRTGNYEVLIRRGWNKTGGVTIRCDKPVPLTILAIIPEVYIGDR